MKLVSWNVNGFRAILNKNFLEFFDEVNADIFCIQETKMQEGQVDLHLEGYYQYYNYAQRKGYSGVAFFTKEKPINVFYGINDNHNDEGRLLTLEYNDFYVVGIYTVNSQKDLVRLDYRIQFEDDLRDYLNNLNEDKPVIVCGDLNVAHQEIDLSNPDSNRNSPGFSDSEREKFTELLDSGFIDTFRHLYPYTINKYSWWSYRYQARAKNIGWRIDYFLVSEDIVELIKDSIIYDHILGSDHAPIGLIIKENQLDY